jgi:LPS-assembly lipoprotein
MTMQWLTMMLRIALVWGYCLLAGCGWRLQGTARLPESMTVVYLDASDRYTDFNRALRASLSASGARLTTQRQEATAVLRVLRDQTGQRVLSVSALNTPEEYEIFYAVQYSVSSGNAEVLAPVDLELTRDYSYDESAVLAKQREQEILRAALARDLAGLVVRRLASL